MGDKFTVADAYLFTVLRWSPRVEIDLAKWPNVKAYVDRVAARPKVQEALKAEGLGTVVVLFPPPASGKGIYFCGSPSMLKPTAVPARCSAAWQVGGSRHSTVSAFCGMPA